MKEERRESQSYYSVFVATDGTEFREKEECMKYENSALGVLRGKIKNFIVGKPQNAWKLLGGLDDHDVVAFRLNSESNVDTFIQWYLLENPHLLNDSHKEYKERLEKTFRKAWTEGDVILMGQNCDGDYYFINTRQNIIDNLMSFDKPEEDTDKKE